MGGIQVYFACPNRPGSVMQKLAKSCGIECVRIVTNDDHSITNLLERITPQLVIFDGFNAEERFGHFVRAASPEAMRVLDMQDFHALRLGREGLVEIGASLMEVARHRPDAQSQDLLRELASLHRCLALAISQEERLLLVGTYGLPSTKVVAAPISYEALPEALEKLASFPARHHAMFIGNWRHKPNRDCAQWLAKKVWPKVRRKLPKDVELRIYGSSPTPEDMALTDKTIGVIVCGYCKDVAASMQAHRLLVAPLRYGAGVKGKLTDAMRHGLVPVTTLVGAEGLGGAADFPGLVVAGECITGAVDGEACGEAAEKDSEAFATAVASLYEDEALWSSLQARSHAYVSQMCDAAVNGKELWASVSECWEALPESRRQDFTGQMLWQSALRSTEWMAKGLALKEELRRQRLVQKSTGVPKMLDSPDSQTTESMALGSGADSAF